MLYARQSKEYIDEDELAKKIVFERTISQVNKYYGDQKEVSLKPGQLSSQLKYGFDSIFEGWRNSIEQVLNASYNDDITTQKSYEVIKKYNQLSSYLKNVLNMKQLSEDDAALIQKMFDDMKEKLELLKQLAIDNNFIDKEDIIFMVDKINKTIAVPKQELEKVPATLTGMTQQIKDKNQAVKMINDALDKLDDIKNDLADPNIAPSSKKTALDQEYKDLEKVFNDPDLDPLEFAFIQQNYDALIVLQKDIKNDISWFVDTKKIVNDNFKKLEDLEAKNNMPSLQEKTIKNIIKEKVAFIETKEIDDAKATSTNPATLPQDIINIQTKWATFIKTAKPIILAEFKNEKDKFYDRTNPAGFAGALQTKQTALTTIDTLDETALQKEEKDVDNLTNAIEAYETIIKDNMEKFIDAEIKKAGTLIAAPKTKPVSIKIKTPQTSQAQAPQPVKTSGDKAIIYTKRETFKKRFTEAVDELKKGATFTNFKFPNKKIGKNIFEKAWTDYQKLPKAAKEVYFD